MRSRPDPQGLPATAAKIPPRELAALLAALLTVVLWASAFVGIRAIGQDLSPGPLALGRLLIGSVLLGLLVMGRHTRLPRGRHLGLVVVSGVVWFALYNVALNAGEQLVDAGTAAMLVNTGPILIAVLAGLLLGEGFPPRLMFGCVVAFAGAVLIGVGTSRGLGTDAGLGVAWCLLAAAAYALGVILQKPVLRSSSPLAVTWLACTVGAIALLPSAPGLVAELVSAPPSVGMWLLYLGVFPTSVAFTTWAYALSVSTAGRLGALTYLVSPTAVLLGWQMLGELPPLLAILGGAVSLLGVALARYGGRWPWTRRGIAEDPL